MGNKNNSQLIKKQNRSQLYQQEQLNRIQREVQDDISSISSSYSNQQYNAQQQIASNQNQQSIDKENVRPSIITQTINRNNSDRHSQQDGFSENKNEARVCTRSNQQNLPQYQAQTQPQSSNSSQQLEKKDAKVNITELENQLSGFIRKEKYFDALEKLFEILFLNRKIHGNSSEQVAFTLHRMSSILCLLGRLEEALKYEYESCQIRKSIFGGLDANIAKSLIYIAKLLWYFKKYIQSFYYILESYNISEYPLNRLNIELKSMIGEVSLEMSNIAHENEQFVLSFKLRILAFQSKRAAFLFDESFMDEDLSMLAHEVWNYKQGVFLLQMIPTRKYSLNKQDMNNQIQESEDNCPICYIEFIKDDQQKELLCSHRFHSHCIDRWIIKNQKCPMCRKTQELPEYLAYQQNRLQTIQNEQNKKILLKSMRKCKNNTINSVNGNKQTSDRNKIIKQQQDIATELVQLSPRTSATFSFLQKETEQKEVDIFMKDYNQHFNILPLPLLSSDTKNKDQKNNPFTMLEDEENQDEEQNQQLERDEEDQEEEEKQVDDENAKINNEDILKKNVIKAKKDILQDLRKIQDNQIYSFTNNQMNDLDFADNFDITVINSYKPNQNQHNHYVNLNDQENEIKQEEDQEEQKQSSYIDGSFQQENNIPFYFENNLMCNNHNKKQSFNQQNSQQMNGEDSNINNNLVIPNIQSNSPSSISYGLYQEIQNLHNHNYNQLNDIENILESDEDEDDEDDDDDEDEVDYDFEEDGNNHDLFEDEDENNYINDDLESILKEKLQPITNQNNHNHNNNKYENTHNLADIENDQLSFQSQQPIIQGFSIHKQFEPHCLYFQQDQEAEKTFKQQQQQLQKHQLQNKNGSIMEDSEVNFDEEGMSETNNIAYKGKQLNNAMFKNNNNNQQSIDHQGHKYNNIQQNVQYNDRQQQLQKNKIFEQSNTFMNHSIQNNEQKLTINNLPSFESKNSNNYINDAYNIDDSDIFDKRPTIRRLNNKKVELFDNDENQNKNLFDTNNIINNNKYMNYY